MDNLRTSPEELRARASQISTQASEMKTTATKMFSIVETINGSVWSGTTQATYVQQFVDLKDDADSVYNSVMLMVDDLNKIAADYDKTEEELNSLMQSLTQVF